MYREDSDSFNGSIGNGSTLSGTSDYLRVSTERADKVVVWIDDGTTGSSPATYDLSLDAMKKARHFTDDWLRDLSVTGSTAFVHETEVSASEFRLDLTNQSGASANYRIFIESIVEDS